MAIALIPPRGEMYEAEKERKLLIREQTTIDPVERYKLREARLERQMIACSNKLIAQAKENGRIYRQITEEKY